ncbi:MAG: chitobiase/beta-hexosaminidase C-terminal domain-containing protein, partial [Bacteroidota bacterium]|nr:chitobiase/beta-hexosaminidase C-terminal domain-containing protein [Bacteroidota bacterium]
MKYFLIGCTLLIFSNLFASADTLLLSHESGWYESSFLLEASSTVGEIVYEINGTTPTRRSPRWRGSMKVNSTTLI